MRLDNYLFENKKFASRTKAKEAIERGEVLVNGKIVKPSHDVSEKDVIALSGSAGEYVSNGAFKLLRAFEVFNFYVDGLTVADIGASTGGFTQVALKMGAKKVFALDVGESLLDDKLALNERVVSIENTNARFMDKNTFGGEVDVVVTDVSFISLTYILQAIYGILKDGGEAVVLVKPQFECGPKFLSKNGIVTDKKVRRNVCEKIIEFAQSVGFGALGLDYAPIREGKNVEFLLHLKKNAITTLKQASIEAVCNN